MPLKLDGPITSATRESLVEGVRSAPMQPAAVEAVFSQAAQIAHRIVNLYETEVAAGEVGADATGLATEAPILGGTAPRALLYGRVQSGKTVAMVLTSAICLDNGFRVVVVLTTDNVALVRQTASRFKDVSGPRVFAGVKDGASYEWEGQEEDLRASIAEEGMILVCAKNSVNLPEVIRFLAQLDASTYPVLVFDDEADAATPDTTVAARASGKANAPQQPSRMYRLVIANEHPDEEGFSLGENLPHSLYVQVTATPFVLLLQRAEARIRPTDVMLLEPGTGYCGGEVFFGSLDLDDLEAPIPKTLVLVGANEAAVVKRNAPEGLANSVDFFLLSACALARHKGWPDQGFMHLSHTSHKTDEHELVAGYIASHLNAVREQLRGSDADAERYFLKAYGELQRSVPDAPAIGVLVRSCRNALRNAEVHRINSKADTPTYGPRLNFIVGGNILGRGLTITDLLVTYYVREAKTSQMDTVWQHARMYGYRQSYLNYVRIYLPPQLAARFSQIHDAEEALRRALKSGSDPSALLLLVPTASRPTRPNALDPGAIRVVRAGRDQINPQRMVIDSSAAREVLGILTSAGVAIDESLPRERRPTKIPISTSLDLLNAVRVDPDYAGVWEPDVMGTLIKSYEDRLPDGITIYIRELEKGADSARTRGRLSGPEIKLLRDASPDAPAVALLYSGNPAAPDGWFPTIVMPKDSPDFVFSGE